MCATKVTTAEEITREFYDTCAQPLQCRCCEHYRMQYELSLCRGRALKAAAVDYINEMRALWAANKALTEKLQHLQGANMQLHSEVYEARIYIDALQHKYMLLQLEQEKMKNQVKHEPQ